MLLEQLLLEYERNVLYHYTKLEHAMEIIKTGIIMPTNFMKSNINRRYGLLHNSSRSPQYVSFSRNGYGFVQGGGLLVRFVFDKDVLNSHYRIQPRSDDEVEREDLEQEEVATKPVKLEYGLLQIDILRGGAEMRDSIIEVFYKMQPNLAKYVLINDNLKRWLPYKPSGTKFAQYLGDKARDSRTKDTPEKRFQRDY